MDQEANVLHDSQSQAHDATCKCVLSGKFFRVSSSGGKKKILQDEFNINMSRAFETEVSEMCNLSHGVWEKGMEKGQQNEF